MSPKHSNEWASGFTGRVLGHGSSTLYGALLIGTSTCASPPLEAPCLSGHMFYTCHDCDPTMCDFDITHSIQRRLQLSSLLSEHMRGVLWGSEKGSRGSSLPEQAYAHFWQIANVTTDDRPSFCSNPTTRALGNQRISDGFLSEGVRDVNVLYYK